MISDPDFTKLRFNLIDLNQFQFVETTRTCQSDCAHNYLLIDKYNIPLTAV